MLQRLIDQVRAQNRLPVPDNPDEKNHVFRDLRNSGNTETAGDTVVFFPIEMLFQATLLVGDRQEARG